MMKRVDMTAGFGVVIGLGMAILALLGECQARTYEWVNISSHEMEVTPDAESIVAMRLWMIRQAKKSVDLMVFDHRPDSVGNAVVDELRNAVQRGVQVRFMVSRLPLIGYDRVGIVDQQLRTIRDQAKRFGGSGSLQFVYVGRAPTSLLHHGFDDWQIWDTIHGKLLLVDGKWVMTGGTGHAAKYLNFMDTGYFFKGAIVAQSEEVFQAVWNTVLKQKPWGATDVSAGNNTGLRQRRMVRAQKGVRAKKLFRISPILTSTQPEFIRLKDWFEASESRIDTSDGRPTHRIRILHHDLINQLQKMSAIQGRSPNDIPKKARIQWLEDPVVNEVAAQLETATNFTLYSFASIFHQRISDKIAERLKYDPNFKFDYYTNGLEDHQNSFRLEFGWYGGLRDLRRFFQAPTDFSQIVVHVPSPFQPGVEYVHRKLMIFKHPQGQLGPRTSAIVGSHNLTVTSTLYLDEIAFQVEPVESYEGPSFVDRLVQLDQASKVLGVQLNPRRVLDEKPNSSWYETWVRHYQEPLY